jgi:hypothetical protein
MPEKKNEGLIAPRCRACPTRRRLDRAGSTHAKGVYHFSSLCNLTPQPKGGAVTCLTLQRDGHHS